MTLKMIQPLFHSNKGSYWILLKRCRPNLGGQILSWVNHNDLNDSVVFFQCILCTVYLQAVILSATAAVMCIGFPYSDPQHLQVVIYFSDILHC